MKRKSLMFFVAALFAAVSCVELESSSDEMPDVPKFRIYAENSDHPYSQDTPDTRTSLASDGTVTWKKNDPIKVAVRNSLTDNASLSEFKNIDADGLKTATFEGLRLPSHENITAIYPASSYISESQTGSLIRIAQTQKAVKDNYPVDAQGISLFPAYAYSAKETSEGKIVMSFKNIAGVFGIEIPAYLENIKQIDIESEGATLAGDFNLAVTDAQNAVLTAVSPLSKVTLVPAEGTVFAPGKYYAVMAPGNYTGIKFTLTTAAGGTFVRKAGNYPFEITRNGRVRFDISKVIANVGVGDYFLSDGTWAPAKLTETNGQVVVAGVTKDVIGYVISKDTRRMDEDNALNYSLTGELDKRIVKGIRHGYVLSKTINKKKWGDPSKQWVAHVLPWTINSSSNPYYVYDEYTDWSHKDPLRNKPYTDNSDKMYGYANSQYWNSKTLELTAYKPQYSAYSTICYVPSLGDMRFLLKAFASVDCTKLPFSNYVNKEFWTSSMSRRYNLIGSRQVHASVTFTFNLSGGKLSEKNNLMAGRQYENNVMYLMAF